MQVMNLDKMNKPAFVSHVSLTLILYDKTSFLRSTSSLGLVLFCTFKKQRNKKRLSNKKINMEDKRTVITNNQARKKIHPLIRSLSIGGEGGIVWLVVFGGALAIAGFMEVASFASNKNKAKDTHDDHQQK